MDDIYIRLARHLENLVMGYPYSDDVLDLLAAMYSPREAEVALAIPGTLKPLETVGAAEIADRAGMSLAEVSPILETLGERGMLYTCTRADGSIGYGLLQVGYGLPQAFLWGGPETETAQRMANKVIKYFKVPVTAKVYGGVETKCYKYTPAGLAVDVPKQGVLPFEEMESIVRSVDRIAVAHCPCRTSARVLGRTDCDHPLEVCLKYDEMADFIVDKGLGRPIDLAEALKILKDSEEAGLVHMVDNAGGDIKHTCNCCGCYCWNVGIINRRRIARDDLMAVYFLRATDEDACVGCGACVEICPVNCVAIDGDIARVDLDWCIGCGVCAVKCPTEAISLVRREEKDACPADFKALHDCLARERGVG